MTAKYEWREADRAVRHAIAELFAAQRHLNHRKRMNVLKDLRVAKDEMAKILVALDALGTTELG